MSQADLANEVYVFTRRVDAELLNRLRPEPSVRFFAATTGPFPGFAVIEVGRGPELPAELERLFGHTPANVETAVPIRFGTSHIRSTRQFPSFAFVRVRVARGQASAVLDQIDHVPGYNGSSIVLGAFDILAEIGAETESGLHEALLSSIHPIDGIDSTVSLQVLDYHYRDA